MIRNTAIEFHGEFVIHYTGNADHLGQKTYTAMVYRNTGTLIAGHTRDSRREVEFEAGLTIGRQMGVDAAAEKARRDAAAVARADAESYADAVDYLRGKIGTAIDADVTNLSLCPTCGAAAGRRHFDECPFHPENLAS